MPLYSVQFQLGQEQKAVILKFFNRPSFAPNLEHFCADREQLI